jgi:hypothetical protein
MAASSGALALVKIFNWNFGASTEETIRWTRVLMAGLSAMALFRTSLFIVRAGDRDIGVGPASFLQIFLTAADRGVDRDRAQTRSTTVGELMKGLAYAKARSGLPPYCLALMRNLPDEEQKALTNALSLLDAINVEESIKVRLLGLELINVFGEDVLREALNSVGDEMRKVG